MKLSHYGIESMVPQSGGVGGHSSTQKMSTFDEIAEPILSVPEKLPD